MHQLESTTPHFIRCIKPNNKQLPGIYEVDLVVQQLRCCGVLEVVRISRSGYPTRMKHQEFAERWIEAEIPFFIYNAYWKSQVRSPHMSSHFSGMVFYFWIPVHLGIH